MGGAHAGILLGDFLYIYVHECTRGENFADSGWGLGSSGACFYV